MANVGRPTKYNEETEKQIIKLALLGCTDLEICDFIEIAETTLNVWKNEYPEFKESLKRAKMDSDLEVIKSLRNRAIGYEEEDVKIFNDQGTPLIVPYTKKVAPDPTSAIFWLKNRQPEKFGGRQKESDVESEEFVLLEQAYGDEDE